jgi:hypothetical protein
MRGNNMDNKIAVQYVGHRPFYRDGACGSGLTFERGGVALVPAEIAAKMLRHTDVWVRHGKAPEAAAVYTPPVVDEEAKKQDQMQDIRDTIIQMDKPGLKLYVQTHWNQDLDGRMSVENMRAKAVELFDQYGLS